MLYIYIPIYKALAYIIGSILLFSYLTLLISGSLCVGNYPYIDSIIIRYYSTISYFPLIIHKVAGNIYFIALYAHIGKAFIMGSYKNVRSLLVGYIILLISMGCSFIGYLLPFGIMSFAGLAIISGLIRNVLQLQDELAYLIHLDNLNLLIILHILIGLILIIIINIHISVIHMDIHYSNIGISRISNIRLYLYKDVVSLSTVYLLGSISAGIFDIYSWLNNISPSLYTPAIIPEWYLL